MHGSMSERLSLENSETGRLQRACLEVLRQHERDGALPTNGRCVFYELARHRAQALPRQEVTDALTYLREHGS
jgi:hypothetical protein